MVNTAVGNIAVINISQNLQYRLMNSKVQMVNDLVVLYLGNMSDTEYNSAKYVVESIGGHWLERLHGFVFYKTKPHIVNRKILELLAVGYVELSSDTIFKIENQFYPTPDEIARMAVGYANISAGLSVLEPSAGHGALLKYIAARTTKYDSVELNRDNYEILIRKGFKCRNTSFEEYYSEVVGRACYDRIVMNPPFINGLDLKHTRLAYELLKPGGRLVGMVADNSLYYNRPLTAEFNTWLKTTKHKVINLPIDAFKNSGTTVAVDIIIIDK